MNHLYVMSLLGNDLSCQSNLCTLLEQLIWITYPFCASFAFGIPLDKSAVVSWLVIQ